MRFLQISNNLNMELFLEFLWLLLVYIYFILGILFVIIFSSLKYIYYDPDLVKIVPVFRGLFGLILFWRILAYCTKVFIFKIVRYGLIIT
jgi:hypothetical protein